MLDRDAAFKGLDHRRLNPKGADAVGDEPGCVLAVNDTLAELMVGEFADDRDRLVPGFLAANNLQKTHVARRVEEMRDKKIALETLVHAVHQVAARYRRRVGGDNAARFANAIDLAVNRLLDVKFFNHRLNDPISFSDEDEVVLNIAAGDSLSVALLHERRRLSFQHALNGVQCEFASLLCTFRHDIEKNHIDAGIGHVGGDTAAHQTGADYRNFIDHHQAASSTVEMPWPPPIH